MADAYVHGYERRENERLQDQGGALVELLHSYTAYPSGSTVLEVACGVGAQTVTLGIRGLYRTAGKDGVFCYTFFKGVATRP